MDTIQQTKYMLYSICVNEDSNNLSYTPIYNNYKNFDHIYTDFLNELASEQNLYDEYRNEFYNDQVGWFVPSIEEDYIWNEPAIHIQSKITISNNLAEKGYYEFIKNEPEDICDKLVMIQKSNAAVIAIKHGLIDMFKILCAEQMDEELVGNSEYLSSEISVLFTEQECITDWLMKYSISGHKLSSVVQNEVYQDILKYLVKYRQLLVS
jgi:hypothetical protein